MCYICLMSAIKEKIRFKLFRTDVCMLPHFTFGIAIYYVWFQSFYNKIAFDKILPYANVGDMMLGIALNFTPIFALFLLMWMIVFGVRTSRPWLKVSLDAIGCFAALVTVNFLFIFTLRAAGLFHLASLNWAGTAFNAVFIFLGLEVVYWFFNFNRQRQEAMERERSALLYKYKALAAQVNPHFLFNSLGTLNAIISAENGKAKQFIKRLSDIYHYILSQGNRETASLDDELSLLNSYIEVLSLRYGTKLSVCVQRETGISSKSQLIPFTLQMLVENVLKHNIITSNHPMQITVVAAPDGITVYNPERPREDTTGHGFALHYLQTRYHDLGSIFSVERKDGCFVAKAEFIHNGNQQIKWQDMR